PSLLTNSVWTRSSFSAPYRTSVRFSLLASTPASTLASTMSVGGVGSFWGGLNSSRSVVRGYGCGAEGMGSITAVSVNQSLLSPLKLEADPNIQAVRTQEKEQVKTLNKPASFPDTARHLEQQNKIRETKRSLLQQQKTARSNPDMLESCISNLRWPWTPGPEKLKPEAEEDFRGQCKELLREHADVENEFVLIKKDVDEAYKNKVELESCLEGLTNDIRFLRGTCEEICELQSQISDMSVVLSMDNSCSLRLDGIITEVKAQYEDFANRSRPQAETLYQIKHEELQTLAGKHGDVLRRTKTEISELNWSIGQLQAEIEALQNQAALEAASADAEQHGELAIKDANAKVAELEATLLQAKQDMAGHLCKCPELMNVELALNIKITTYRKRLEGKQSRLESGTLSTRIHTKTSSSYSCGLSSAHGGLPNPGLNYSLSSFQANFGPAGSFSGSSSSKAVVVKKIDIVTGSWCPSHVMSCP
uniref:Keratin, type II cytoskeletal 8 n=1 Tax=Mustela putorius furo TaxID=9669 RepID=M3XU85_MUSPF